MGMADDGKVIIQVALNETHYKDKNPNIPYGPDEVVPAAIAAAQAGASIVHFHGRTSDGTPAWNEVGLYADEVNAIREVVDMIAVPSFTPDVDATCDELELVPIENGTCNLVGWDAHSKRIVRLGILDGVGSVPSEALDNPDAAKAKDVEMLQHLPSELAAAFTAARESGLLPLVTAFELGWMRHAICAWRAGELLAPAFLSVFLFDQLILGPSATPAGLDAYINEIPAELDHELMVVPYLMNDRDGVEALLRHALERGQNIRVGIGDSPSAFPTETNEEVVRWAVGLAAEYGRVPATADDVRRRFAMSSLTTAQSA